MKTKGAVPMFVLWPDPITARRYFPREFAEYEETMNFEKVKNVHRRLKGKRDCILRDSWPVLPESIKMYMWPSTLRQTTHLW